MRHREAKVAVVGGGVIGSLAALGLARSLPGEVVHIAPTATGDERTTALLNGSIDMLKQFHVWDAVSENAAPLRTMRLIDGSKRLFRARPIDFDSSEIGLETFGYNVRNDRLLPALAAGGVTRVDASVTGARRHDQTWTLETSDGKAVEADIVVAADGRRSVMREAAGIPCREWSYPQTALVTTFSHQMPHRGVSAEFHTETGPFTQVPLPETESAPHRSSLVWVVRPQDAGALQDLGLPELSDRIADGLQHMFGALTVERPLASYPLSGMVAHTSGRSGVLLVGEAAHVFPPIGAQGANLGFRDVADAIDCLKRSSDDPDAISHAYARSRKLDVASRTAGVDALNRSLLTDFLPVQFARAAGMSLLAANGPLRRRAMEIGLSA